MKMHCVPIEGRPRWWLKTPQNYPWASLVHWMIFGLADKLKTLNLQQGSNADHPPARYDRGCGLAISCSVVKETYGSYCCTSYSGVAKQGCVQHLASLLRIQVGTHVPGLSTLY
jgi:hypothetical protein